MISKYSDTNKFGRSTYHVQFNGDIMYFEIHETEKHLYLVEFKESYLLFVKTRFSFISSGAFRDTLVECTERLYDYALQNKSLRWPLDLKDMYLNKLLQEYELMTKKPGA